MARTNGLGLLILILVKFSEECSIPPPYILYPQNLFCSAKYGKYLVFHLQFSEINLQELSIKFFSIIQVPREEILQNKCDGNNCSWRNKSNITSVPEGIFDNQWDIRTCLDFV